MTTGKLSGTKANNSHAERPILLDFYVIETEQKRNGKKKIAQSL